MEWKVPNIWKDGTCFIIGGGPSMLESFNIPKEVIRKVNSGEESPSIYSSYLEELHNKHVIGVNMAFKLGLWIDIIFFGDKGFFLRNEREICNLPKLRVSCTPHLRNHHLVKYLKKENNKPLGLTKNSTRVCWNYNSGAAAINLAIHTGVKKIILLGFDMYLNQSKDSHWHKFYKTRDSRKYKSTFDRHLKGFPQIAKDAKLIGVEIINTSMNSMISSFQKIPLKEIL